MGHDDEFNYDILGILEGRENEEFELLQRLSAFCQDTHSRIAASLEQYLLQEKEYEPKLEKIENRIALLHKGEQEKNNERDDIALQQKVIVKKIAAIKDQMAEIEEETKDAKMKKESIALEMVDLEREFENGRKQRKERWNAVKMACMYYKENLDIYIDVNECKNCDKVKVTFFHRNNPQRDNYYATLENREGHWTVGEIQPPLNEKHLKKLSAAIDLTKSLKVLEVVAFLCKLRKLFLKHDVKQ